jgi:hypothetical protein
MSDTSLSSFIWKNVPFVSAWFQPGTTETEKESKRRQYLQFFTNTNLTQYSYFHWIQLKTKFSILNRYRLIIHENRCSTTAVRSMLSLIPPPSTTTTSCSTSIITDAEDTNKLHPTSNLLSNCNKRMTDVSKTNNNDTNNINSSPTKLTTPRTSNACTSTTVDATTTSSSSSPMCLSPSYDYYYPSQNKHPLITEGIMR